MATGAPVTACGSAHGVASGAVVVGEAPRPKAEIEKLVVGAVAVLDDESPATITATTRPADATTRPARSAMEVVVRARAAPEHPVAGPWIILLAIMTDDPAPHGPRPQTLPYDEEHEGGDHDRAPAGRIAHTRGRAVEADDQDQPSRAESRVHGMPSPPGQLGASHLLARVAFVDLFVPTLPPVGAAA